MSPKKYIVACLLATLISGISGWYHFQAMNYITCSFQVIACTSMEKPVFQIFYNIGKGFVEKDSRSFMLNTTPKMQAFSFTINSNTIYGLRLDVLNGSGEVIIKGLQFSSNSQKNFFTLSPQNNYQLKQIASIDIKEGEFHVVTSSSANDPYLHFTFQPSVFSSEKKNLKVHTVFAVKIFIVLLFGLLLIMKLTNSEKQ